jgi:hypothetical protein
VRVIAVALLALSGCAFNARPERAPETVPVTERAQALNEVITVRAALVPDDLRVDACSVFLALDRDAAFRERFSSPARSRLDGTALDSCPLTLEAVRRDSGWYVRTIERRGSDELVVVASANGHGGHNETYLLNHGYGDRSRWRVAEVRMSDFWFE